MLEISHLLLVSVYAWSVLAQMDTNSKIGKASGSRSEDICIPAKYRESAEEVLRNMKNEIEPCDDFYQFACGKFMERVKIPEGSKFTDAYRQTDDTRIQQIMKILTEERPERDPNHFKLPNKFYKSCMNTSLIDRLVDDPVREISNSLGGWPVVVGRSWDSDNSWSWQELVMKLRRLGFSPKYIMTFYVDSDVENKTRNIIYLYEPTFLFESDIYDSVRQYNSFMVDTAVSFGASRIAAIRELTKVINFEMELIEISEMESNSNYVDNLLSITRLQELYPYIQWLDLINSLLPEGLTVDENELINLLAPNFFDQLGPLLARTDKRTIANYIMWKFHYFSMNFLSKRFRNKQHQFGFRVLGIPLPEDRSKHCESLVSTSLPIAISSLYANNYFTQISKNTATRIFENIRNVFMQTLHETEWLDDNTKEEAKRKVHSMKAIIGFPDEVFDVGRMEEYYRELEIDENKYFQSYLNIMKFHLDKHFHALRMPVNETEWLKYVILGPEGPYNDVEKNEIHIPPAYIQGQFFNIRHPNYMNYGSIGYVMAHEISHGFSGDDCRYCADGEAREWWQPASEQALSEREICFIEQYSNYTDKHSGLKINGLQTLQENIADNSGAKFSYLAYKQWQAIYGAEPRLSKLKYTPQQLFWISLAQVSCAKFTPGEMEERIKKSIHSPHEFRVLGVLRNMKDFSEDFNCPENSPMNPVQKCEFW